MEFLCRISKLFVYLSLFLAICQSHPVVNSDGIYTPDNSEPELAHQTELSDDLALHSQAELSADSGFKVYI